MFIELTDHLRCPLDHPESFLVLIPDEIVDRSVRRGTLGCPVCRAEYRVVGGVARFADAPSTMSPPAGAGSAEVSGSALLALLGLEGPGGYLALVGNAARFRDEIGSLLGGVHLVGVNPGDSPDGPDLSALWASRLPLKSRSMRGVVLGEGYADDPSWQREGARVVLPGRRVVGQGVVPGDPGLPILASAGGWWVGQQQEKGLGAGD